MMNQTCLIGGNDEWTSFLEEEATAEGIPVINNKTVARAKLTVIRERRRFTVGTDCADRVVVVMFNF
jgi:hypothetical protein